MAITILYQDAHIVACVKEAGVSSQSPGMPERIAETIGGDVPLAVHRLDRDVAGVMVYARTPEAASSLTAQITAGTPEKIYYAILRGSPEEAARLIGASLRPSCGKPTNGELISLLVERLRVESDVV